MRSRPLESPSPPRDLAPDVAVEFESDGDRTPAAVTRRRDRYTVVLEDHEHTERDAHDANALYAGDTYDQFDSDINYLSHPPSKTKKSSKSRAPLSDEEIGGFDDRDVDEAPPHRSVSGKGKGKKRNSVSVSCSSSYTGSHANKTSLSLSPPILRSLAMRLSRPHGRSAPVARCLARTHAALTPFQPG